MSIVSVSRTSRAAIAAVLATLLVMVGCQADDTEPEGEGNRDAGDEPASQTDDGEEITLRFVSFQWGQAGYEDFFNMAIDEFRERHPNVTIEPIPVSLEDIRDYQTRMLAAGDPPEILHLYFGTSFAFQEAGWTEPLTDRIAETDFEDNWTEYLWEDGQHEGELHTLLVSGGARMLMYNRAILDEAGVSVPTTPEEFLEAAQTLTTEDQFGVSIANAPDVGVAGSALNVMLTGLGGGWTTDGEASANTPEAIQAIEILRQLVQTNSTPEGIDRIGAREVFWEGRAAMHIEGPWVMTSVKSENPDLLPDIEVAPIPFPNQAAQMSNGFAIARDAEHKDLAWEFIAMIGTREWMQRYLEMTGVEAGRIDLEVTPAIVDDFPWLPSFLETAQIADGMLPSGLEAFDADINRIVSEEVADVLFGSRPVDEATEEIHARIQSEIVE